MVTLPILDSTNWHALRFAFQQAAEASSGGKSLSGSWSWIALRKTDFGRTIYDNRPGSHHQLGAPIQGTAPVRRSHVGKPARSTTLLQPVGDDQFGRRPGFIGAPGGRSPGGCRVQRKETTGCDNFGSTPVRTFRRCPCRRQLEHRHKPAPHFQFGAAFL